MRDRYICNAQYPTKCAQLLIASGSLKFVMTVLCECRPDENANVDLMKRNILFKVATLALGYSRDFSLYDCPSDGGVSLNHKLEIRFFLLNSNTTQPITKGVHVS